jgi:hypothetical protein
VSLQISWSIEDEQTEPDGTLTLASTFHILEFDVVTSEEHSAESDLTEHVVESTEAISDHKRAKPREISIGAHVTNTPLSNPPNSGFAQTQITSQISPDTGDSRATVRVFSGEFDRLQDVETTLDRLRREAIDLTVETRVRTYENVQLVSYTIPRSADTGDALDISLRLREVFRATTQTVEAPLPREPRGGRETESAAEPEPEEEDADTTETSLLGQLLGGF